MKAFLLAAAIGSRLRPITDTTPIGYDLLPPLVGRGRAVLVEGYFCDIGSGDAYRQAREEWPARASR